MGPAYLPALVFGLGLDAGPVAAPAAPARRLRVIRAAVPARATLTALLPVRRTMTAVWEDEGVPPMPDPFTDSYYQGEDVRVSLDFSGCGDITGWTFGVVLRDKPGGTLLPMYGGAPGPLTGPPALVVDPVTRLGYFLLDSADTRNHPAARVEVELRKTNAGNNTVLARGTFQVLEQDFFP